MSIPHRYDFQPIDNKRYHVFVDHDGVRANFDVEFSFDTPLIFRHRHEEMPGIAFDLLRVAIAVYTVDWHSERQRDIKGDLHVTLPVKYPQFWSSPGIEEQLSRILYWYTEDEWQFKFIPIDNPNHETETRKLPLCNHREVALWSGGLDSFAGLIQRLTTHTADEYLLFGTGSDNFAYGKQVSLMRIKHDRYNGQRHRQGLLDIFTGRIGYQRLHIKFSRNSNIHKNSAFRVRAFSFILLGSVTAYLEGQNNLHTYENGIGAINLTLSKAEVGLDHARSVHPASLFYVEELLRQILGDFTVRNPFWDTTKAQMCTPLESDPALQELAFETVTCDTKPRVKDILGRQCGHCTSCLLRRQAFSAANIWDKTLYGSDQGYFPNGWDVDLRATLAQVRNLRRAIDQGDQALFYREYPMLNDAAIFAAKHLDIVLGDTKDKLYTMYQQYVSEWSIVGPVLREKLQSDFALANGH